MGDYDAPGVEDYQRTISSLRDRLLDMENDTECIPEDYSVTEYVTFLRGIASEMAGVRNVAERLQEYIKGGVKSIDMLVTYAEAVENAIADLSPEARDYKCSPE